jgi:hypothetical protein
MQILSHYNKWIFSEKFDLELGKKETQPKIELLISRGLENFLGRFF